MGRTSSFFWTWSFVSAAFAHLAVDEIPWVKELQGRGLKGEATSSRGCFNGKGVKHWGAEASKDFEGWIPLTLMDFVPVNRSFYIQVPKGVGSEWPAPLLFGLHSQGDQADVYAASHEFGAFGKALNFITVYPQGREKWWGDGCNMSFVTCCGMLQHVAEIFRPNWGFHRWFPTCLPVLSHPTWHSDREPTRIGRCRSGRR